MTFVGISRRQAMYMTCRACDAVRKRGRQDCENRYKCQFVIDILGMWEDKGIIECTTESDADRALKDYHNTSVENYTWPKLIDWVDNLAKGYGHLWRKLEMLEGKLHEDEEVEPNLDYMGEDPDGTLRGEDYDHF